MSTRSNERFEALYRAHSLDVLGYCARRTSREEAKDAASEVFVVALRKIDEVPGGDRTLPWLYTVAKNVIYNRNRSARRRLRLAARVADDTDQTVPGPEIQVVRYSEHERLIAALEKLSDRDREILRLVEWEGVSREHVAEMFFVSRAAIDQRISRAYKRLSRMLGVRQRETSTTPVPLEQGGEA
jgi:RNA polymerase sigma-70 factor (ECF subfamily)